MGNPAHPSSLAVRATKVRALRATKRSRELPQDHFCPWREEADELRSELDTQRAALDQQAAELERMRGQLETLSRGP
jgi:chromosome segregation ATPase